MVDDFRDREGPPPSGVAGIPGFLGKIYRFTAGFADDCGAGIPHAQNIVGERGRRDARSTNLAESQYT